MLPFRVHCGDVEVGCHVKIYSKATYSGWNVPLLRVPPLPLFPVRLKRHLCQKMLLFLLIFALLDRFFDEFRTITEYKYILSK